MELLVSANASVNVKDADNRTPLLDALSLQWYPMALALVLANVDVNESGRCSLDTGQIHAKWCTKGPAELAFCTGQMDSLSMLAAAGADLNPVRSLVLDNSIPDILYQCSGFFEWVDNVLWSPSSLQLLCRAKARQLLGSRIRHDLLPHLPLPSTIIRYLNMSDLHSKPNN